MPISIVTNTSASRIAQQVHKEAAGVSQSLVRLSSGNRFHGSTEDAGAMAVSMKLSATQSGIESRVSQIDHASSFLQVQQGALSSASKIFNRISELKTSFLDVTKNSSDRASYDAEFLQLAEQLQSIQSEQFNGISLFSEVAVGSGGLNGATQLSVKGSADGEQVVSISRSVLNVEDIKQVIEAGQAVASGIGGLSVVNIGESDAVAQVETLTIGGRIAQGDVFTINLREQTSLLETESDTTITYTASASDEAATDPQQAIRDALVSALNGNATTSGFSTAAAGGSNTLTLTSKTAGDPFSITSIGSTGSTGTISRATNQANVVAVAQVDTYNISGMTVETGDTMTVTLDGSTYTTASLTASASATDVANALNTAIGGSEPVTVAASGNNLTFTANAAGTSFISGSFSTTAGMGNTTENTSAVAQEDTLTVNLGGNAIAAGDEIEIDVNGTSVSYTAVGTDTTAADLATGIANEINASAVNGSVTASAAANDGTFTITSDAAGTAFSLANNTLTIASGTLNIANTTTNVSAVAQVDTLNYLSANLASAGTLTVTLGGSTYTTASLAASASATDVANALNTAIGGVEPVTAAASGNNLTFTANVAGTPFNLSNTTTSALFSTTANNVVAQQQVETVTIGADSTAAGGGQIAVGDQYSVTINGAAYSTTATAGQSASELRAALLSLVNTDGASVVTASTGAAAGELVLTADVAGTGFTISQTETTSADSLSAATTTANVSPFSLGKSLKQLSEMMGFNGAEQSQLEAARDQLSQNQVHYQSAQSRIRDVDVARESAAFARSQIRLQAVQSLLMQANLVTDSVLQLLR